MKFRPVSFLLLFGSLIMMSANLAAAPNLISSGAIPVDIYLYQNSSKHMSSAVPIKQISLQKIFLSPEAKVYLAAHAKTFNQETIKKPFTASLLNVLPPSVRLGMENVPVLDQGKHGTCVTFSVTAAVDALLKQGDYISQLCNLALGAYLQSLDEEYDSGWEGSNNHVVLEQIQKYGIVSMNSQKTQGCGTERKVYDYPLDDEDNKGVPMSITDFTRLAKPMTNEVYWKPILRKDNAFSIRANEEDVIVNTKKALRNGHRVLFGLMLDIDGELKPHAGAVGKYHVNNDAWILTDKIKQDLGKLSDKDIPDELKPSFAGHEMIITGYDDNAIIEEETSDHRKIEHRGIFILRNSVGSQFGDQGDNYVSYDYFKLIGFEVVEISPTPLIPNA